MKKLLLLFPLSLNAMPPIKLPKIKIVTAILLVHTTNQVGKALYEYDKKKAERELKR